MYEVLAERYSEVNITKFEDQFVYFVCGIKNWLVFRYKQKKLGNYINNEYKRCEGLGPRGWNCT